MHRAPAQGTHPGKEVERGRVHSVLALKTQLIIGNLQCYGHQDCIAGDAQEIEAVVELDLVMNDARRYHFRQILKFHRRRLPNLSLQFETAKFIELGTARPVRRRCHVRSICIGKPGRFGGHSLLLGESQASSGNVKQSVFFRGVGGQTEFASAAGIHKLQLYVLANALNIVVGPIFEGVGLCFTAALIQRALVVFPLRVALKRVGLTVHDVNAAAIGSPAGNAGRKMLIGISDAAIMLFFHRIIDRIRIGIAPLPELLDELLAFFVRLQCEKSFALGICNDEDDILVQPLFVRGG